MVFIQFKHIRIVQNNIGNGITEPKIASDDNNTQLIIKTYHGPEGERVLFNEYLCYRLAILVDIPMPESGICLIDKDTIIYNDCVNEKQYGYGFYSTYVKSVPLMGTIIPLLNNKDVFYKLLLFDHIIFNADRNRGNLLVQYYKKDISLWVIDHSHVFINQAVWDANCLIRAMEEKDYYSTRILDDNSFIYEMFFQNMFVKKGDFERIKELFKNRITENRIVQYINDMPKEWLPPQKDMEALLRYILYRIDHIDDICITILNYVNRERG